jgi:tetratricopeptide (TPR) repeat protein
MTIVIAVIIILGVGVGFLAFFLIKSIVAPQKVEALAGLIKKGKSQVVIKAAKNIISRDPKNAEAHYYLGQAYHIEKRDELALMEFKSVNQIGISGKNIPEVEFRQTLAQMFVRHKEGEEALKEYLLLIKINPQKAEYYYWAGKLFFERNRADMAEKYLRKAAELNPRDSKIHFELGAMLYRDKKPKEAKAELEAALKFESGNAQAFFFLGKIQKDVKDYVGAIASFEKSARDAEYKIRALVERGGCYMSLNAVDRAIPDLERAVSAISDESANESLYARYFLAMCYEKNRDLDKAIAQWEKIYARKKNFRDVGAKLTEYQELRSDDNMKDYLISAPVDFTNLCRAVAVRKMDFQVQNSRNLSEGCELTAIENDSAKWRNTRKMPCLMRFFRCPDPLDEAVIRSILDDAKKQNIPRTIVVTSSGFTRAAVDYANSRAVELFNKEKLQDMLQGVDMSSPKENKSRQS